MKRLKALLMLAGFVSLATVAAAQEPTSLNATNFGVVGITRGQTLVIHAVAWPPDPCFAQLGFQDTNGNPVGAPESVSLQSGQSARLAVNGDTLAAQIGQRVQLLPTVVPRAPVSSTALPVANHCVASVEVFNNALGITTVVIPGSVGFATTTQFGLMGITALQTVRLNVAATGTQPCFENFSWTMGDGTPVGPSGSFGLAPGKVGSVDQAGSSLVTGFAERVLVRPVLTPVPGPNGTPSGSCVASMEVTSTAPAPPWFIGLRIHATQHAPSARSSKLRQAWPA
jgi:hypothetical protein